MDSDGSWMLFWGGCVAVILVLKMLYRLFHTAITEANDARIKSLSDGNKRYLPLFEMITSPRKMLFTMSIFDGFCAAAVSVCTVVGFFSVLAERISAHIEYVFLSSVLAAILLAVILSMVIFILSDSLPRRLAAKPGDALTLASYRAIRILMILWSPFTGILSAFSSLISKILGISGKADDAVTEEQILMLVEAGNETGVIEENERDMISNVLEFNDAPVSEVMTHRTDLIAVDVNMQIQDIVYLAINEGFSRIPVFDGSIDSILGLIFVKDLLCLVGCEHTSDFSIRQFMRDILFVPETNKCNEVFEYLTQNKAQAAIVVDEYGGTAGMVTMEDLLEEIVGNIQDEYDDEEEDEIRELSDGSFSIDGAADPEDILPRLGVPVPEDKYDTMSALLVDLLGRIPEENEASGIEYQNIRLSASVIKDNWISRIEARKIVNPGEFGA